MHLDASTLPTQRLWTTAHRLQWVHATILILNCLRNINKKWKTKTLTVCLQQCRQSTKEAHHHQTYCCDHRSRSCASDKLSKKEKRSIKSMMMWVTRRRFFLKKKLMIYYQKPSVIYRLNLEVNMTVRVKRFDCISEFTTFIFGSHSNYRHTKVKSLQIEQFCILLLGKYDFIALKAIISHNFSKTSRGSVIRWATLR